MMEKSTSQHDKIDHDPPSISTRETHHGGDPDRLDSDGSSKEKRTVPPARRGQIISGMNKAERKRFREKRRRNKVNEGFDELFGLLLDVDEELRGQMAKRAKMKENSTGQSFSVDDPQLMSRIDVVHRATLTIRRLNEETRAQKATIKALREQVAAGIVSDAPARLGIGNGLLNLPISSAPNPLLGASVLASKLGGVGASPTINPNTVAGQLLSNPLAAVGTGTTAGAAALLLQQQQQRLQLQQLQQQQLQQQQRLQQQQQQQAQLLHQARLVRLQAASLIASGLSPGVDVHVGSDDSEDEAGQEQGTLCKRSAY